MTKHKWIRNQPVNLKHASYNQCQLIAANRPKIGGSGHPQLVVEIRFLRNVIDARALIGPLFPRDLALLAYLVLLAWVQHLNYRGI